LSARSPPLRPVGLRSWQVRSFLLAVGLTVNSLATAMSGLSGVAKYGARMPAGSLSYASQAALALGHVGLAWAMVNLLENDSPASVAQLLAIAALYLAGVLTAVAEWKRHRRQQDAA